VYRANVLKPKRFGGRMNREKIELAIQRLEELDDFLREPTSLSKHNHLEAVCNALPDIICELHEALTEI
jgi:hypothetical protein